MSEQKQESPAVPGSETGFGRRAFLRRTGFAGLSLAGAAMLGRELGLGAVKVEAASLTPTDIQVFQFALNIEYAEAEFYSYGLTGKSLQQNGINVAGAVGTLGATTGGAQFDFSAVPNGALMQTIAEQVFQDEMNHIALIQSLLGTSNVINKPAIKLDVLGPMSNLGTFLLLARDFGAIAVSAYGGSISEIDAANLTTTAQIALVEAMHLGNVQLMTYMSGLSIPPIDSLDRTPPPSGQTFFDNNNGLAVIRTPSQILADVYLNGASGTAGGGLFPAGFNGPMSTVS